MSPEVQSFTQGPVTVRPLQPVAWHVDNKAIFSADFQPGTGGQKRLATGGADKRVRIWHLYPTATNPNEILEYRSSVRAHSLTVNAVRFSPSGEYLASTDDEGTLVISQRRDVKQLAAPSSQAETHGNKMFTDVQDEDDVDPSFDKEQWVVYHKVKVTNDEVYDIAWSPDNKYLLLGTMKNITIVFDVKNKSKKRELAEHTGIVQGVAWDPLDEYIATQSSDRTVHIYMIKSSKDGKSVFEDTRHIYKSDKADLPVDISTPPGTPKTSMDPPPPSSASRSHSRKSSFSTTRSESPPSIPEPAVREAPNLLTQRGQMLYGTESATTFFRRLTFSPDGSLLLTPTGLFKPERGNNGNETVYTVYIYSRRGLNRPPVAHLPGLKSQALAVRFSPIVYKLRDATETVYQTVNGDDGDDDADNSNSNNKTAAGALGMTNPVFKLDYRMVYAVALKDCVIVYDTLQPTPLCIVTNMNYHELTDLAWSHDGQTLLVSSTDGYCTVVNFAAGALGEVDHDWKPCKIDHAPNDTTKSEFKEPKHLTPIVSHVPPAGLHGTSFTSSTEKRPLPSRSETSSSDEGGPSKGHDNNNKKKRRIQPELLSAPSASSSPGSSSLSNAGSSMSNYPPPSTPKDKESK